jgi:uncharacterized integral membrane protein (TIGR00698 family)
MWAFIFSIVAANLVGLREGLRDGVSFCSGTLLKATIAVMGLVTSASIWLQVGVGVVNALVVILVSFFFSTWLGKRLGISPRLATLIGVGTSICGASAIAATAPAIGAKEEEIGLAVAGITLFGLISMFLYPFLFTNTPVGDWLLNNLNVYAVWVGSGVHETAQVIAAAGSCGSEVIRPAMLIKSVRIFMIGPAVLTATYFIRTQGSETHKKTKLVLPLFGVLFIVNSLLGTFLDATLQTGAANLAWLWLKSQLSDGLLKLSLSTAFAGVGSKVRFSNIAELGTKPFVFAALMAVSAGTLALAMAVVMAQYVAPFA